MGDLSDLLKAVNARKASTSARLTGEEATKALEAIREREFLRKLAAEEAAKEAGAEPEPADLRRSTMTPSAKSAYIRARGLAKYQALPK